MNGATYTNWTGQNITLPTVKGSYFLTVNSTDRFGHYTVRSWKYVISDFLSSPYYVADTKTYKNSNVVIGDITVLSQGKLTFDNSTIVLTDTFSRIDVLDGGQLTIKGPVVNSGSKIVSTGNQYRIITSKGSKMLINNTQIDASVNVDFPSTFDLKAGKISRCSISGLMEKMRISGAGVTIQKSDIMIEDPSGGIKIDMNHTWGSTPTVLLDLKINGTSEVPLEIEEASIYTPYDGGDLYYADDSNATFEFRYDKTGISDPLVRIPYFVDSRSPDAEFGIYYYNGADWTLLSGISISDTTMDEWTNGEEAVFNLSAAPDVANYRISWMTDDPGLGCAYLLNPVYAGNNTPVASLRNPIEDEWTPVTSDVLQISNVSIVQADISFVSILSSGNINIHDLKLNGIRNVTYSALELIRTRNSDFTLMNTSVNANPGLFGVMSARFDSMNDWPTITLENDDFRSYSADTVYNIETAVTIQRGWLDVQNLDIHNASKGLMVERALININGTTINAEESPIFIELPFQYPEDVEIELRDVEIEHYSEAGLYIYGDNIDYNLDIQVIDMSISSNNNTEQERMDGMGAVTVMVTGDTAGDIKINGVVDDAHGHIIAVNSWLYNGEVVIHNSVLSNAGIDGIYFIADTDLRINNVVIDQGDGYGIYTKDHTTFHVEHSRVSFFDEGGLLLGDNSYLTANDLTIDNSTTTFGLDTGSDSHVELKLTTVTMNFNGILVSEGTYIKMDSCTIKGNTEYGIKSRNADIVFFDSLLPDSIISDSGRTGLFAEGGTLDIKGVTVENNYGTGIKLWNVEIIRYSRVSTESNYENGLSIFISNAGLAGNSPYCWLNETTSIGNGKHGIVFTYDPTSITKQVEIKLYEATINGNGGFDFTAPEIFHSEWDIRSGEIGSEDTSGKMRVNGDFTITGLNGKFTNMNVTLLGIDNYFEVSQAGVIEFENCFISTERSNRYFYINMDNGANIKFKGCYMDNLGGLYADGSQIVEIRSTLIRDSPGGIHVKNSRIIVKDSRLEDISGKALFIENSEADIIGSSFHENSYGIWVNGLSADLDISGSSFTRNNWGIYLFDSRDKTTNREYEVTIEDSRFLDNGLSSIWTVYSNVTLLDTTIDLDSINVKGRDYFANITYTLEVKVLDEDGDPVDFVMDIDQGLTSFNYDSKDAGEDYYSEVLTGFMVVYEDDLETGYSNVTIDMTYSDGSGTRSFILNKPTSIVFNGPIAPWKTPLARDNLVGEEDIGLNGVYVDIAGWFTDNDADKGKLRYSVNQMDTEIMPHIEGTKIWVTLKKDWYGEGNFSITATDPHDMSITHVVRLSIGKVQDPPVATNPRIIVYRSSPPREVVYSGEVIQATWEWYDVDGDAESKIKDIHWYLNGKYSAEYEGMVVIKDVEAGQIWNFTIIPTDTEGSKGTPVSSPHVVIQNIPPTLDSVKITNLNPTTETDLIASPVDPADTESDVLIFHYMWERKIGEDEQGNDIFANIGASDSPMLHHTFTRKYDTIRVSAWVSDGYSNSEVRTAKVFIQNTKPRIVSARLSPDPITEETKVIGVKDIVWVDPDGDSVYLGYRWSVNGVPISTIEEASEIDITLGRWEYPLRMNITVQIRPFDEDNDEGDSYYITGYIEPTDTDGDGDFDDANGNGINDFGDDTDDDNDGYPDYIEEHEKINTDPKDPNSKPRDTDGDGLPDGDALNSAGVGYVDFDDDNDGLVDDADSAPTNPNLPGDMDKDGIGDDVDPDIDGDRVRNEDDWYPRDPDRWNKPESKLKINLFDIFTFLIILILLIAIVVVILLVYTGKIALPTSAPPTVEEADHEAIIEEEETGKKPKAAKELEEMEEEELENMSVCSECGELVSLDDPQCPNCGAEFEEMEEFDEE
ncbi:MAG: right-handed parallel beta-helix repeat-containing protein [Thermoplasmatota archaeon]